MRAVFAVTSIELEDDGAVNPGAGLAALAAQAKMASVWQPSRLSVVELVPA